MTHARANGTRRATASWLSAAALFAVGSAGGCSCEDEANLTVLAEDFRVVEGVPTDDVTPPAVDRDVPVPNPDAYRVNVPYQCDSYEQLTLRKVDILWVVDTSASMEQEQIKLAQNFTSFINFLTSAQPPIDFHLGVMTTDTERENEASGVGPGWLRHPQGAPAAQHFIACDGGGSCNVGTPQQAVTAFQQVVQVGTDGNPVEKGLLAAMLGLTEPVISTRNAGFLRDDASLYVIVVSDEEDSSCLPFVAPGAAVECHSGPNCRCEDGPSWGDAKFFARFFDGLKGFGNEGAVGVAAIVATSQDVLDFDDRSGRTYVGCTNDPGDGCAIPDPANPGGAAECAMYAPRYVQVARETGGIATSICDEDFSAALSSLGFAVSGLKSEFKLSRAPFADSLDVVIVPDEPVACEDDAGCSGGLTCVRNRCAQRVSPSATEGYQWLRCQGGVPRNVLRTNGDLVPDPLQTIEICYEVDVGTDLSVCE